MSKVNNYFQQAEKAGKMLEEAVQETWPISVNNKLAKIIVYSDEHGQVLLADRIEDSIIVRATRPATIVEIALWKELMRLKNSKIDTDDHS